MRKLTALFLVPVLAVLLAAAVFAARGGDGDTAGREDGSTSSAPSTRSTPTTRATQRTTSTTAEPDVVAVAEPADAPAAPASPPAAPTPTPPGGACDSGVVHDAIAGAVADGVTFDVTYLECAEGFGWAQIVADFGDGATVFFEASGGDITVLDLGTAVCPTAAGMPESIATQLAPPGSRWREECGP